MTTSATGQALDTGRLRGLARFDVRSVVRVGAWAVADQAVISVANMVTMVLLARALSPSAFGSFTLAYTALLFLNSLQFALITQPHNVLGASLGGRAYVAYTSSTAVSQLAFSGACAVVAGIVAFFAVALSADAAVLLVLLVPAMLTWQLQDFFRRILYTEGRIGAALVNDVVSYGGQTAVIVTAWAMGWLTGPFALGAIALTSLVAVGVGVWQTRKSLSRELESAALKRNWDFGKWLAGAQLAYGVSTHGFLFIAAAIAGTAASGALKAVQVLLGPLNLIIFSIDSVLPPRLSRTLSKQGLHGFEQELRLSFLLTAPLVGLYCALAAVLAGPLMRLVYGEAYADYAVVLVILAAYTFVIYVSRLLIAGLRARQLSRPIFVSYVCLAVVAIVVGSFTTWAWGTNGAAIGMLASAVLGSALLWRAYRFAPMVPRTAEAGGNTP